MIPVLGHLAPVTFNEGDADVILEEDISPCLLVLASSFEVGSFVCVVFVLFCFCLREVGCREGLWGFLWGCDFSFCVLSFWWVFSFFFFSFVLFGVFVVVVLPTPQAYIDFRYFGMGTRTF